MQVRSTRVDIVLVNCTGTMLSVATAAFSLMSSTGVFGYRRHGRKVGSEDVDTIQMLPNRGAFLVMGAHRFVFGETLANFTDCPIEEPPFAFDGPGRPGLFVPGQHVHVALEWSPETWTGG